MSVRWDKPSIVEVFIKKFKSFMNSDNIYVMYILKYVQIIAQTIGTTDKTPL